MAYKIYIIDKKKNTNGFDCTTSMGRHAYGT